MSKEKAEKFLLRTSFQWVIPVVKDKYLKGDGIDKLSNYLSKPGNPWVSRENVYRILIALETAGELKIRRLTDEVLAERKSLERQRELSRDSASKERERLGLEICSVVEKEGAYNSYQTIGIRYGITRSKVSGLVRDFMDKYIELKSSQVDLEIQTQLERADKG
jgi:hypothetical protein